MVLDRRIDATAHAKRQPESRSVDRIDHVVELVRFPAHDMQRRAEHFVRQQLDRRDFVCARQEERAVLGAGHEFQHVDELRVAVHACGVFVDAFPLAPLYRSIQRGSRFSGELSKSGRNALLVGRAFPELECYARGLLPVVAVLRCR